VPLTPLRTLEVSAASGLVRVGDTSFVVADDELGLLVVPPVGPTRSLPLLPGALPDEPRARKAHKPDFEALCRWGADGLLALGSGSTAARRRACLLRPVSGDLSLATSTTVDLAPLHAALAARLPALNLEGAALVGDALVLLQRGNGVGNRGALVELDAAAAARALARGDAWDGGLVRSVRDIDLGERRGAPLGFTDASPLPDGSLVFCAAAEASVDTYEDGAVTGAALGRLGPDRALQWLVDVPGGAKLEGVHAEPSGADLRVWLVADPDDRSRPAQLWTATLDPATGAWR
jgi:hypothetical protein